MARKYYKKVSLKLSPALTFWTRPRLKNGRSHIYSRFINSFSHELSELVTLKLQSFLSDPSLEAPKDSKRSKRTFGQENSSLLALQLRRNSLVAKCWEEQIHIWTNVAFGLLDFHITRSNCLLSYHITKCKTLKNTKKKHFSISQWLVFTFFTQIFTPYRCTTLK